MRHLTMRLFLLPLLLFCVSVLSTGCAMCCAPFDEAYAGYGGKWQRDDQFHGRVGSPFSDPNYAHSGEEIIEGPLVEGNELEVIE